ncbi:MAG: 50S ribosomal protein L13 [Saprospiraceae bacterium]
MDTLSYKTKSLRKEDVEKKWYVIDATNQTVGRLSSQIAIMLRGKHKPSFTPHVDCGDNIIVINAEKVRFTGNKMKQKIYQRYSGYMGGQSSKTAEQILASKPTDILEKAVKGMLPKNRLGRVMFHNMFVYTGTEHPHEAQKPEVLTFD